MQVAAAALGSMLAIPVSQQIPLPDQAAEVVPIDQQLLLASFRKAFEIRVTDTTLSGVDAILLELAELEDGWFGEGSAAPTEATLGDIRAAMAFCQSVRTPEIEVDEDGSVALVWQTTDGENFALTFLGNGKAVATSSPQHPARPPISLPVSSSTQIASMLVERRTLARAL